MVRTVPITEIDSLHACLAVGDLEESARWYREVLGFTVVQSKDFPDLGARLVFMKSHGVELELVESAHFVPVTRPDPPADHVREQGITQLSFRVHDIESVLERIRARSIPVVVDLVDAEPLKLKAFFIRDNEGNLIEFIERYT